MTDQELRHLGQGFIDQRKKILLEARRVEVALDPVKALEMDAEWDYIDPFRLGIFVMTRALDGAFEIDMGQIRKLCLNPTAFKQQHDESARIADFQSAVAPIQEP